MPALPCFMNSKRVSNHPGCYWVFLHATCYHLPTSISLSAYKHMNLLCSTMCPLSRCFISSLLPAGLFILWKGRHPGDCLKETCKWLLWVKKHAWLSAFPYYTVIMWLHSICGESQDGSGHSVLHIDWATCFYCEVSCHTFWATDSPFVSSPCVQRLQNNKESSKQYKYCITKYVSVIYLLSVFQCFRCATIQVLFFSMFLLTVGGFSTQILNNSIAFSACDLWRIA